jgi:hypothetical protein
LKLAFKKDDVTFKLDDDLFFVNHYLCNLAFKVRYESFLGLEFRLNLLVSYSELFVLCLDLIVELLNTAEVVDVAFEIDFLLLSKRLFH